MPVLSTLGAAIANVYGFTSGLIKDQYFNLVSLLLPGNGTDGKQNRTFLDSSGQNGGAGWTITPNGNATQGTFSPFSQTGWGGYFDGSNDYVTATLATALTSTYTIDFWINTNSVAAGDKCILNIHTTSSNTVGFVVKRNGSQIQVNDGATGGTGPSGGTLAVGVWKFVTIVCNATNTLLYIDGSLVNTYSGVTLSGSPTFVHIGSFGDLAPGNYADAYISNLRIIVGSAITPSATPPTSPSQSTGSTTKLLTLQSNRFVDNGTNSLTVTPNNGAAIVAFSPFAPTQSYSAAAVGGSGYFDGNLDYLNTPSSASLGVSNGNFTLEFWAYQPGARTSLYPVVFTSSPGFSANTWNVQIDRTDYAGKVTFWAYNVNTSSAVLTSNATLAQNTFYHIAFVRNGATLSLYINGTLDNTANVSTTALDSGTTAYYIGSQSATNTHFYGYISGMRLLVGSASAPSSIPTSPPTAITNTSLLLNFTNAGVVDATAKNVLETVGNAQISTTQSKWGGGSISFASASNSNLLGNTPSNWTFLHDGSTWTVEFWLYPTDISSFQGLIATNGAGSTNIGLNVVINAGAISISFTRGVSGSAATFNSSAVLNANQWNYVGVTFTGSTKTCAFFINGASAGSSSNTGFAYSSSTSTYPPYIGQTGAPGFPYYFNGYIDDLRITRGVARTITANPTAPFPVQ